jgi:hypothetical protein
MAFKPATSGQPELIPLWPDAGQMAGLSRGSTYKAADRGEIPPIRIGNLRKVPLRKWRRVLGIED